MSPYIPLHGSTLLADRRLRRAKYRGLTPIYLEHWLESASRRYVYPEVICSTLLPEYRGLTPISE